MGMAASQCNLIFLYSRKNTINNRLGELALQKRALTREARNISLDCNNAINKKVYKWTNGVNYQTLTYESLMKPNALTQNKNYLITDLNDRVVLDSTYAEYAKMFSPDGKSGANWSGDTRLSILSKLTGVSKDKIASYDSLEVECRQAEINQLNIENNKPDPKKYNQQQTSLTDLMKRHNKSSNVKIPVGDSKVSSFDSLNLSQIANYLGSDKNKAAWKEAVDALAVQYKDQMASGAEINSEVFKGSGGNYNVNWDKLSQSLLATYQRAGGEVVMGKNSNGENNYQILWFTQQDYKEYKAVLDKWQAENDASTEALGKANNNFDSLLTAEEERLIKYYDTMFSAIAEKGWVYNENVNDPQYLNDMLQNNQFMITTVNRSSEYDEKNGIISSQNDYDMSLPSQLPNLAMVSDSDAREDALIDYEARKERVSAKETMIDLEIKNKETELEAIKNMIESVLKVKNDNIERTFNIFS